MKPEVAGPPLEAVVKPTAWPLKFAVLQQGARMHYAVPALLHRAGMLRVFYTDVVGNVGPLNLAQRLIPNDMRSKAIRRLLGRRVPDDVPRDAVISSPMRALAHAALSRISGMRALAPSVSPGAWMRRAILDENFRNANALYVMDNGDLDVIQEARRRGMFIVYEQICSPEIGRILWAERNRFPGLEPQDAEEFIEWGIKRDLQAWSLSDVVLAPSPIVREAMLRLGCAPDKVAVVPYGLSDDWFDVSTTPTPGRVLFVGSVRLLKGNHYLARAYHILRARGVNCEFRVVGPCQPYVTSSPIFAGPDYVGQIPRSQVREELLRADVLAFPTLSEGFGLAHLEAMAYGIPVVTTPNCGSVVRNGVDGFIVPVRDAAALADRIEEVIVNRTLRAEMSESSRARARRYSWSHYSTSLLDAITTAAERSARAPIGSGELAPGVAPAVHAAGLRPPLPTATWRA